MQYPNLVAACTVMYNGSFLASAGHFCNMQQTAAALAKANIPAEVLQAAEDELLAKPTVLMHYTTQGSSTNQVVEAAVGAYAAHLGLS